MRLILTGPRSVGKTSIGKNLSTELGIKYISGDKFHDKPLNEEEVYSLFKEDNFIYDLVGSFFTIFEDYPGLRKNFKEIKKHISLIGLLPYKDKEKSIKLLTEREMEREHFKDLSSEDIKKNTRKHYEIVEENIKEYCDQIFYVGDKSIEENVDNIKKYLNL